mmetsp:Transcript_33652/g.95191  ORF Transcript_33652/g.95191 Transcript_33652/m.95191 type:complete len:290 (+) Transcript_33652:4039-4908(+)
MVSGAFTRVVRRYLYSAASISRLRASASSCRCCSSRSSFSRWASVTRGLGLYSGKVDGGITMLGGLTATWGGRRLFFPLPFRFDAAANACLVCSRLACWISRSRSRSSSRNLRSVSLIQDASSVYRSTALSSMCGISNAVLSASSSDSSAALDGRRTQAPAVMATRARHAARYLFLPTAPKIWFFTLVFLPLKAGCWSSYVMMGSVRGMSDRWCPSWLLSRGLRPSISRARMDSGHRGSLEACKQTPLPEAVGGYLPTLLSPPPSRPAVPLPATPLYLTYTPLHLQSLS